MSRPALEPRRCRADGPAGAPAEIRAGSWRWAAAASRCRSTIRATRSTGSCCADRQGGAAVCFLPTASGDPREQVTRFHERFGDWPCEPSVLSLFHLGRDRIDPVAHILAQDALYIGGGSMRNMLAIWREHGIDEAMRTAWERGIVLAGLSAGAMCWFEGGVSMSGGQPEVVHGIGLLSGQPLGAPRRRVRASARSTSMRSRPARCRPGTPPMTAPPWSITAPAWRSASPRELTPG